MTSITGPLGEAPTEPEPDPAPTVPASGRRQYVVLCEVPLLDEEGQDLGGLAWRGVGSFDANTTDEAIRKAAAQEAADPDIDTSGVLTYVAVPSRSFQPVALTAKVEPKIEFRGRA